MLSCSIRFSAPSFWMGGGLESRCVGRVYGADGAVCSKSSAFHFYSKKNFGEIHTEVIWIQSFLNLQSLILISQKFIIKFPFLLRIS